MQQWKAVTWVIPSSLARTSPCRPGVRNRRSLPCLTFSPMASKARAGSPANENQASVNVRGWSIGRLVLCRVRIAVDRICRRRYGGNMRKPTQWMGKRRDRQDCVRQVSSLTVSERSALWLCQKGQLFDCVRKVSSLARTTLQSWKEADIRLLLKSLVDDVALRLFPSRYPARSFAHWLIAQLLMTSLIIPYKCPKDYVSSWRWIDPFITIVCCLPFTGLSGTLLKHAEHFVWLQLIWPDPHSTVSEETIMKLSCSLTAQVCFVLLLFLLFFHCLYPES